MPGDNDGPSTSGQQTIKHDLRGERPFTKSTMKPSSHHVPRPDANKDDERSDSAVDRRPVDVAMRNMLRAMTPARWLREINSRE